MNKLKVLATILLISVATVFGHAASPHGNKVVVAYVTSWTDEMPDPSFVTHVNYAFGHVNNSFDGVDIDNTARLASIVSLKNECPALKVLLSVGGWGSGRFSEMAADSTRRMSFAEDCRQVVDSLALDGIDIDWEYPGSSEAGISSSPDDKDNFTLLMRDLRRALGNEKYVTLASACNPEYIDFRAIVPYIDFVNIMSYDMGNAPLHHAALYPSENTGEWTCDSSVKAHIATGVPADKLVMGIPFYGRGGHEMRGRQYNNLFPLPEGYTCRLDTTAQVPYVADADGNLVLGYDDAASIAAKCRYIADNGLHGAMYWAAAGDDSMLTLARTVAAMVKGQTDSRKILVLSEGGGQHGPFTRRAMPWIRQFAASRGMTVTELRNASPITDGFLAGYDLIIQLDFPPYTWPQEAMEAFQSYIDQGKGGWIGFHHATLLGEFDGYPMWNWFSEFMGGIRFQNYIAALADGTVNVEDATHPVMRNVNQSFILRDDEWYTYDKSPREAVEVIASVDEGSYEPESSIRMGDHPVIWTNPEKKARNIYFQFGHSPRLFESADFIRLFANAIDWASQDD